METGGEPKGQTRAERAHHLGTLHGKLCATLRKKARSVPGAPPPGPTNAPQPKAKPAVAVDATLQPPWTARQAQPAAPASTSAPSGTRTHPATENPGWLDFLPEFSPKDHDPDVASWWFHSLLLGIGTALLHPLAATGGSMRALGYASLFGATSLTVKAAASSVRKGAQWLTEKVTDFFSRKAAPDHETPAAPPDVTDDTFRELGPTEFREYILPWLVWPTVGRHLAPFHPWQGEGTARTPPVLLCDFFVPAVPVADETSLEEAVGTTSGKDTSATFVQERHDP